MSNLDELRKKIAYFNPQIGEFEDDDLLEKATLIQKKTPAYRTYGLLGMQFLKWWFMKNYLGDLNIYFRVKCTRLTKALN